MCFKSTCKFFCFKILFLGFGMFTEEKGKEDAERSNYWVSKRRVLEVLDQFWFTVKE